MSLRSGLALTEGRGLGEGARRGVAAVIAPRLVVTGGGIGGRVGGEEGAGRGGDGCVTRGGGCCVGVGGVCRGWGWGYWSCVCGKHARVHEVMEFLCEFGGDYVVRR